MRIEQAVEIDASPEAAWEFLMDLEAVGRCVPGVERVEVRDADTLAGAIRVKVGPIGLLLDGEVRMTARDPDARIAELDVRADDRRIGGGLNARTTLRLVPSGPATTTLNVATDASLMGRLGQFGQPIIRRKADEMAREFAANVAAALRDGAEPA